MPADFNEAIEFVLRHEDAQLSGKITHDDGGLTRWGISQKAYPNLDIANLSLDAAKAIYQRNYWNRTPYAQLDQIIANKCLDCAVNMGMHEANLLLQRAVNQCGQHIEVDGAAGEITIAAANCIPPQQLLCEIRTQQRSFYEQLAATHPADAEYLRGWLNRADA